MRASSRERERTLLDTLIKEGYVSNQDLVSRLGLSRSTVRRTLEALSRRGLVRIVHGGAVAERGDTAAAKPAPACALPMQAEKRRIAAAAAGLIHTGDMLFIDTGSTTYELVPYLKSIPGLTVLTNDINVAHELVGCPDLTVNLTGGTLGTGNPYCLVGRVAEQTVGLFVANKCIIGTSGIDPVRGITEPYPEVAQVKAAMIRQATEVILIADHTKLGRINKAFVAPIQAVHTIITDSGADPEHLDRLRAAQVQVIVT